MEAGRPHDCATRLARSDDCYLQKQRDIASDPVIRKTRIDLRDV